MPALTPGPAAGGTERTTDPQGLAALDAAPTPGTTDPQERRTRPQPPEGAPADDEIVEVEPDDIAEVEPDDVLDAPDDDVVDAPDDVLDAPDDDVVDAPDAAVAAAPGEGAPRPATAAAAGLPSEAAAGLPPAVEPWLAQLVHGYCPPDGQAFLRPAPPTNFPGRDPARGGPVKP
jgi:hypothetical protein